MAKMRAGVDVLDAAATGGGGVALTGVGSMELGEERGFVTGVVDGLRYVGSHFGYFHVPSFYGRFLLLTGSQEDWVFERTSPA